MARAVAVKLTAQQLIVMAKLELDLPQIST